MKTIFFSESSNKTGIREPCIVFAWGFGSSLVRVRTQLWRAQPWETEQAPRFPENLARLCPPHRDFLSPGCFRVAPDHALGCSVRPLCPGAMLSAPPSRWLLFTERFYTECFSFRIGSFNMFYRKPFYVPIKNERL